jgi:outer membrane murein-binding lipoprotein Lpp
MKQRTFFLVAVMALTGCTDEDLVNELQDNVQRLQSQVSQLESSLENCEFGAAKLFASMEVALGKNDFQTLKQSWKELEARHPDSPEYKTGLDLYNRVLQLEEAERKRIEAEVKAAEAERLKALNRLKKEKDDVSGVTWYKQPYFEHYANMNRMSIYLGDNGTKKWLRLKMSYKGEDWIFFEHAYLSYDDKTFTVPFDEFEEKESDNSVGGVWEWIDVSVSDEMLKFLREFAESPNAKMRLSGKYSETRTLSQNERKGIQDVLAGFDALKSK